MLRQRMLGLLLAGLSLAVCFAPGGAAGFDGADGVLAVLPWDGPQSMPIDALEKECWIVGHTQDMALFLLPPAFPLPEPVRAAMRVIETPASQGDYFFVLLEDPSAARFEGSTRVLAARGHTVLVATDGATPRLTASSRAGMRGLVQPVHVALTPKAWPSAAAVQPEMPARDHREFHPLVDAIVADVSLDEYVAKWQVLDDFETRYTHTSQNVASSQWMYDYFTSLGLEATFHEYQQSGTKRNVYATLPGLVEPDRVVYICGHFDSISEIPETSAPGADDNGSGTAAFLEAARVLSQYAFHYTIRFIGFNGEEQGLYGSAAYVADIAAAGEDVVGCYNFDMIAYRGTDPAPADLVIYTDNNSLELAQTLEDACLTYFPNDLEPLVTVSSMSGSDHASFWNYGYKAICGIEDEAWGGDFCPWYHTSNDRIEQYPTDYPTHCATAGIAAVAQTAIPMQPDVPYLALDSWTIDDDASGASSGNGNGIIEYSETIELGVTLENLGIPDAVGVEATLLTDDTFVSLLSAQTTFGNIPGGGGLAASSTPFVFAVHSDVPDEHVVDFALAVTEQPDTLLFSLPVLAPDLNVVAFDADDTVGGDGDGIPEPGETIALTITVANDGHAEVADVIGVLTGGAFLEADPTPQSYGTMAPGAVAEGGPFSVAVSPSAPELYTSLLTLALTGALDYERNETFGFNIGDIFADDIEDGGQGWSHYAGGTGFSDEWHVETYRNHTYGGSYSWKCGGAGGADYGDLLYAVLESSPFTLPASGQLSCWHWMEAEVSGAHQGYCYDGGLVEISIDGGPWETIDPVGGYPYLVREGSTPGPFPAETPVFSGSHDWEQVYFDLSGYEGSARVRFAFGSDGADSREGWYIDDLELTFQASAVGSDPVTRQLRLHPVRPNPFADRAALRLDLPRTAPVEVQVYDATGRRLRVLQQGTLQAGYHVFTWDGLDAEGARVGSGIYWIRAQADGVQRSVKTVVTR